MRSCAVYGVEFEVSGIQAVMTCACRVAQRQSVSNICTLSASRTQLLFMQRSATCQNCRWLSQIAALQHNHKVSHVGTLQVGNSPQGMLFQAGTSPQGMLFQAGNSPQGMLLQAGTSPQGMLLQAGTSPQGML